MVPSILVAVLALLFGFNFALIEAGAATLLDTLRSGSLPQKVLNPSDGPRQDDYLSLETEWDVMRHQGGNSPWIAKQHGVLEAGIEPPPGCRVDQVHMVGSDPEMQ